MVNNMSLSHIFFELDSAVTRELLSLQKQIKLNSNIVFSRVSPINDWSESQKVLASKALQILLQCFRDNRDQGVQVSDTIILDDLGLFESTVLLQDGLFPYKGLNYYGFTVICKDTIPSLLIALQESNHKKEYKALFKMLRHAVQIGSDILHCGI